MMINRLYKPALKIAVACIAILGVTTVSSYAQVSGSETSANERITVFPPQYNVIQTPVPDAASQGFAVAKRTSISQPISYSDLDLSTSAGLDELQKRITVTATAICRELNKRFPSDLYWSVSQYPVRKYDCVQTSVKDAMERVIAKRRVAFLQSTP
jgi:UrcA family protein